MEGNLQNSICTAWIGNIQKRYNSVHALKCAQRVSKNLSEGIEHANDGILGPIFARIIGCETDVRR